MGDQYAAYIGVGLDPGGEVYLVSDDGVVHALGATEVADGAETGVDPDA